MKISLCVIAKNEEKYIKNCLKSAAPFADDIVVADTGSSDATKEIAAGCGARVFDFKWTEDFSAARNFAANKAKYDWVLVLDADEEIVSFNKKHISALMRDPCAVGRVALNELGVGDVIFCNRLSRFYNRRRFHFTGSIHEQVTPANPAFSARCSDIPAVVNHIGYSPEIVESKGKLERNRKMLELALEKDPDNSYYLYQLGKAYFAMPKHEDAIRCFEKALSQNPNRSADYVYSLIECYGYSLLQTSQYKKSMELLKYTEIYKSIPNFTFLCAHIYLNNGMISDGFECFERVTASGDTADSLGLSRLAYYNMGLILEAAGMTDNAKAYYKFCGDYGRAVNRLEMIANTQGVVLEKHENGKE